MNIIIDDQTKICEIQAEFNKRFPFLKLEFFGWEPEEGKKFSKKNLITDVSKTIGEIRHIHIPGHLKILGSQKVKTLENNFADNFGINVQVFRKSNNVWILTTVTDTWTLEEQNRIAEESSLPEAPMVDNSDDLLHEQP